MYTLFTNRGGRKSAFAPRSYHSVNAAHSATYTYNGVNQMATTTTMNPAMGVITYLAHDHLGPSRFGFNQSKTQVSAHEHFPYGPRYAVSGTTPYHEFTDKPWDPNAQQFYFPFRYYSPAMA